MDLFSAEPLDHAVEGEIDAVPLAVVRHADVTLDALASLFDQGYAAVARCFADGTLVPAGPAIAVYRGEPMEVFDLEIGFPVTASPDSPLAVDGLEVVASILPSGTAVVDSHIGPYDGLGGAWAKLVQDAAALGRAPSGVWIEAYVSNPVDTAPESLRTDLILPTRG